MAFMTHGPGLFESTLTCGSTWIKRSGDFSWKRSLKGTLEERTRNAAKNGKNEVALQGPCYSSWAPCAANVILPGALQSKLIDHLQAHVQLFKTGSLMAPALQPMKVAGGCIHA